MPAASTWPRSTTTAGAARQHGHPIPLPVNEAVYQTWADVLGDARRLLRGEEGLDFEAAVSLLFGGHRRRHPSGWTLDLGGMLAAPDDIVIDFTKLAHTRRRGEREKFQALFGSAFRMDQKPSPLTDRVGRMLDDMRERSEPFDRKLRYFFWLN